MKKRFNSTGVCVSRKHYMVNITKKLTEIKKLIDSEFYFTINKPRQYGKTTTLNELVEFLKDEYLVISISFEGIGDKIFQDEKEFSKTFIELLSESMERIDEIQSKKLNSLIIDINNIKDLSRAITNFVKDSSKDIILFIDEVDKSSNNQLFLSFIGMLRNKYLAREVSRDVTFKSVILAGLYDVKSLKLKLRVDNESKLNSPWNIAVDFDVDMSFSIDEIGSMLFQYCAENNVEFDVEKMSEGIHRYTNGYPFLVSRICQIIDEKIIKDIPTWTEKELQIAVKLLLEEKNTLFDTLIKNLENNKELYIFIEDMLVRGIDKGYNIDNPIIELGIIYGYFMNEDGKVAISNRIFAERIYNYMISKLESKNTKMDIYNFRQAFILPNGGLDVAKILERFQQFMKEQYSLKDTDFLETHGRLLFLAFLKPIINGTGFDFKEVQVSEEKRMDVVITYNSFKYIIEMKIWRGSKYHESGIKQLCGYLDIHNLDRGYLVIFNFNKNKEFKQEILNIEDKEIVSVYV